MQVNSINSSTDYAAVFQPEAEKSVTAASKPALVTAAENDKPEKAEDLTKLQNDLADNNISLNFSRDEKSGEIVVKLVDSVTGEAIRQLPTDVSLKLTAAHTKLQGQFINKQG